MFMRVQAHTEQHALVNVLHLLLQQHPQIALIVLDSATFHFRHDFPDAAQRARLLTAMAQQLAELAEVRGVAVVMVNQVVTRITHDAAAPSPHAAGGVWQASEGVSASAAAAAAASAAAAAGSAGLLAPALGEGWGQAASCRVALFWQGAQRYALVAKAKHVPVVAAHGAGGQRQGAHGAGSSGSSSGSSMCVPYYVGPAGIS
jgi:RAD51-like protein 2